MPSLDSNLVERGFGPIYILYSFLLLLSRMAFIPAAALTGKPVSFTNSFCTSFYILGGILNDEDGIMDIFSETDEIA